MRRLGRNVWQKSHRRWESWALAGEDIVYPLLLERRGLTMEAVRAPSIWQADAKANSALSQEYYQHMPHPFSELFLLRASIAPPQTRKTIPTLFLKEGQWITDLTL